MKHLVLLLVTTAFVSCARDKSQGDLSTDTSSLMEYVYVDWGHVIHTKKGCDAIYKEKNTQSIDVIPIKHIWEPSLELEKICSKCVTNLQIKVLDSIVSSPAYHDRMVLYESMKEDYETPTWYRFNSFLDKEDNRKYLFRVIEGKYGYNEFVDFDAAMTNYSSKRPKRKTKTQL